MKTIALITAALGLIVHGAARSAGSDSVVLVVSAHSRVSTLSAIEVRELFLGMTVAPEGQVLHAVRNASDTRLSDIFLQNVVAMSANSYRRRVLGMALEQGRRPPPAEADERRLFQEVETDPNVVTYAWSSQIAGVRGLKAIRVLWRD
ncbi:MAG: hypothetical protein KGL92_15105 [Gammaproteobacteria bacterium]|nr:hypothetical protein [Gammaproteobacteria bacterium]